LANEDKPLELKFGVKPNRIYSRQGFAPEFSSWI